MRIAYLINQYPKVSHTFIRREIHALEKSGFEVERIALRGWDSELIDADDLAELQRTRYVLRDGVIPLMTALMLALFVNPVQTFRALAIALRLGGTSDRPLLIHIVYLAEACRIHRWLAHKDVQHLHAHFGTNAAEVAMLVRTLGGPSWSFTIHGPEEFDKAPLLGLPEKIKSSAFVVAISSFGRSQIFRLLEYKDWAKVEVIRCGLDAEFFATPQVPIPSARRLVCVGRLTEQKGQLILIEAAAQLASRGVDFELILAGDGETRSTIEELIAAYGLEDRVQITGWIDGPGVRNEILNSRALVLPSFAEGLPVVLMEAMALGRPVVSTFVAGIPELVSNEQEGWLVPAGDSDALAEAMLRCLEMNVTELERMGTAGQLRVRELHNIDEEVRRLGLLFSRASTCHPAAGSILPE